MNRRDTEDAEEAIKSMFLRSENPHLPAVQHRPGRKRSVLSAFSVSLRL